MANLKTTHKYTCDLSRGTLQAALKTPLMQSDAEAAEIIVTVTRDGEAVSLSGMQVYGYLYRPAEQTTIPLRGTATGSEASVVLEEACYAQPGYASLAIQLQDGAVRHTVLKVDLVIQRTGSDQLYTGEGAPTMAELIARIEALEASGDAEEVVPAYWLTHLNSRVDSIRAAMAAAGWQRSAFLWYHDAHWSYNYKQSPLLLRYLYRHTPINKTIFGGDIVDAEGDTSADMAYLWEWRAAVRDLPNHHSVVGNHDDGNAPDNRWDDAYIYNYLLAAEETPDVVRGESGLYYYIDTPAEKTRYLYLDTASYDGTILSDKQQQTWLKTALLSTPDGWHIVAVAHIWVKVDYTQSPPVVTGLDTAGKYALDMFDAYNARTGDYAACNGKVEFAIGGHSHVDGDLVSDGGIPVILTECDGRGVRSGLSCTKGTITEQSVNAVIADYTNGIVTIVRVGRGSSRVVNLDGSGSSTPDDGSGDNGGDNGGTTGEDYDLVAPTGNFVNQIKVATDGSGNVYNTYGYKNDTRLSTSSLPASERSESGWDLTGYIPVKPGDVVRLKNLEFYEPTDDTAYDRCGIFVFDQDLTYVSEMVGMTMDAPLSGTMSNIKHDANGQLEQFTMTTHWDFTSGYMRICAHNITGASIITVNEEIDV